MGRILLRGNLALSCLSSALFVTTSFPFSLVVHFIGQVPFSLDVHRQAWDEAQWFDSEVAFTQTSYFIGF